MAGRSAVLAVRVITDSSRAERGLQATGRSVTKLATGIAKYGAAAGVAAVAGIGLLAKSSVAAASDVAESQSKVGVVFGKSSAQIVAASKRSATAMGLSTGAYLEATGTLGNLLVSLKIAPKAAADMSQQMVKLAGDLASFNNVSPEEALAAIKSGLTGETEPLRAFGVNMNDATLRTQALKLHLIKTTKDALTPQVKALAAQALIMDQTKTAQGDFARTSGGLANQQRILAAQFDDVKAKLGAFLLPLIVRFVKVITSVAMPGLRAFFGAFKDGDVTSKGFVGVMERMGVGARNLVQFFIRNWPTIRKVIGNVITAVTLALVAVVNVMRNDVIPAVAGVVQFVIAHWPQIQQAFLTAWSVIKPTLDAFLNLILTLWTTVLQPVAAWIIEHWPQISAVIKAVFIVIAVAAAVLIKALQVYFNVLAVTIRAAAAVIGWLLRNIVVPVFNAIRSAVSNTLAAVRSAINSTIIIVRHIGEGFRSTYVTARTWINNLIGAVRAIPGQIAAFIGSMASAGTRLVTGLFNGIRSGIKNAGGAVADVVGRFVHGIASAINSLLNLPWVVKLHIKGPGPLPDLNFGPYTLLPRINASAAPPPPSIDDLQPGFTLFASRLQPSEWWTAGMSSASTDRQNVTVNVNFTGLVTDPDGVARQIQRLLTARGVRLVNGRG